MISFVKILSAILVVSHSTRMVSGSQVTRSWELSRNPAQLLLMRGGSMHDGMDVNMGTSMSSMNMGANAIIDGQGMDQQHQHQQQHAQHHYHPQQQQQQQYQQQEQHPQRQLVQPQSHHAASVQTPPPPPPPPAQLTQSTQDRHFVKPPKVSLEQISLALRLTSEWNRRLLHGISAPPSSASSPHSSMQSLRQYGSRSTSSTTMSTTSSTTSSSPTGVPPPPPKATPTYLQQRGGSHPVNVHPSRQWHAPISRGESQPETELTLFHAKAPRKRKTIRRGVARWGPEMLPYLRHIAKALDIEQDGIQTVLAMIYLDRACSVETLRSSGVPSLPFCVPRTAHRLSLVAMIVAGQAVHGGSYETYFERIASLGIPCNQLRQMTQWFREALGDQGMEVTVPQMQKWCQTWSYAFEDEETQQQPVVQRPLHSRPWGVSRS